MIKSLIASLHFTLKIISMSKLTRQKFLQDLDPSISSTSSKLTCRLRSKSQLVETSSKLTCRLHSKSQLVDSAPNSTCRLRSKLTCRLNLSTSSKLNLSTSSKRTRQLYLKLHANLNLSISSTPLENLACRSSQKSQLSFAVSSTPQVPALALISTCRVSRSQGASSSCRTLASVTSKLHSLILSISSISFRKMIPKLTQNLTLS